MIETIHVKPNTRSSEIFFFTDMDFTTLPNIQIAPLFGPNGVGKSTLIKDIQDYFMQQHEKQVFATKNIPYDPKFGHTSNLEIVTNNSRVNTFVYANSQHNFKTRQARTYRESFDINFINSRFDAQAISEGQSIIYSSFDLLDMLREGIDNQTGKGTTTVVLLDEIDSGMSIDNIDITMRKIKNLIRKRPDIQVIMSFNSPRVLKTFPHVISMYDGKTKEMHTDEDMMTEIKLHKQMFDKARKTSKGRPKIFN